MTFEQAFKKIKAKFENVDASQLRDMAIQITLSDEDCGGTLYAAVKDGVLFVEPYDYRDNDAVLDVTRASLTSILTGKTSIEKEIEKGNLTVKGDLEKISAVKNAVKPPVKAAVKKAAPKPRKKAAVKKETVKTAKKETVKPAKKAAEKSAPAKKETVKAAKADVKTEVPEKEVKTEAPKVKKTAVKKAPTKKSK